MAVPDIVLFPDPRLRAVADVVTAFDDALVAAADALIDALRGANAVGITGPHIGVMQRIVVLSLPDMTVPQVYINPEVIWTSSETLQHDEGSVSMPGVVEKLTRAQRVRVRYRDLDGQERIEEAEGFLAVCHQHEIDQLNGIFWIDRLSPLKRERTVTRFKKLHRA